MGADVPSLGLSNKAVLEGDQSVPEVDKHVKDQYPDVYFKPDAYDKPPTEDTLVQNTLWPEIQKVKKRQDTKSTFCQFLNIMKGFLIKRRCGLLFSNLSFSLISVIFCQKMELSIK